MNTPEDGHEDSEERVTDHGLPHWTEPGTGQTPVFSGSESTSSETRPTLSDGPQWADDPATVEEAQLPSPPPRVDLTIGDDVKSEDFFSYEQQPDLAETTESIISEGKRSRRSGIGSRETLTRVLTGIVLAGIVVLCLAISKLVTVLLVAIMLGIAATELFQSLFKVGWQPPTLVGLVACVAMPLGAYWKGEGAIGLILFLTVLTGALWYLLGIGGTRPVPNLAAMILGVVYVGVLGSHAVLLLDDPKGKGLFLAAIFLAAGYDMGGYFIGQALGRSPLTEVSPNKTIEGLLGGTVATVGVGVLLSVFNVGPFDGDPFGFSNALLLGVVTAVIAPVGDLAESLIKRDLKIKDMGTVLPGHGGVLDRCDTLLFVLPTVFYMVKVMA
ncbi:MAG: phosphatidate cytidylyltransferase [Actinomycetota bacterium]|nr:phosphatidate cytidylyltransferase [Actinomycetota bacterium]